MNVVTLQGRISQFLLEELDLMVPCSDTDLVETGLLDSLSLVSLLAHLEEEFGLEISLDDLDISNFSSIRNIAAFVAHRMENTGPVLEQAERVAGQ